MEHEEWFDGWWKTKDHIDERFDVQGETSSSWTLCFELGEPRRFGEGGLFPFGEGLRLGGEAGHWSRLESLELSQLEYKWWMLDGLRGSK